MGVHWTELSPYAVIFLPAIVAFAASNCSVTGDDKTQQENMTTLENTTATFSYRLPSRTEEKFRIDVQVCQNAFFQPFCTCRWLSITSPKCTNRTNYITCEADSSGMNMSLLVRRTDSEVFWMIIGHNSTPVLLKHTQLQVTYPPQITQLFVNGEQVNGTHIIDEKQEVNISCSFINGNPPVSIRLLNDTGHTITSTIHTEGHLAMFLGVYNCHDLWPTLRCEAPGSKLNRSVEILVRCPPQLTLTSTKVVELTSLAEGLNVGLRSYTSNISKCLMMKSDPGQITRAVTYELRGHAPTFNLTLRLAKESWIGHGNWTLKVENQFGDTNIAFELVNTVTQNVARARKQSKALRLRADISPSSRDTQQPRITIVIISGCLMTVTASSFGILLLCVFKKRQGVCVAVSASRDSTEEQQEAILNQAGVFQVTSHAAASCLSERELLEPTSGPRHTDGLIYGELEFPVRAPSNVIIGSLPNTQYAQIKFADSA